MNDYEKNLDAFVNRFNEAIEALDEEKYDNAIAKFDAFLCSSPPPHIAMSAWYLLGRTIFLKFDFPSRLARSLSDEEYYWSLRAAECIRKSIEIYEQTVVHTTWVNEYDAHLAKGCRDLYEEAKEHAKFLANYGHYVERYGQMQFRPHFVFYHVNLPSLACLSEYEGRMKEVARREHEKKH